MPPKTVLVTGATGFIGRNLLKALRNDLTRFKPLALTRRTTTDLEQILDYHSPHDNILITDFKSPINLPTAPDIVIHLAATMDFFPHTNLNQNIHITKLVLDACVNTAKRVRFVYVSTTEAVGPSSGGDETVECHPVNAYGRSKLECEALVNGYADRLDIVIARPTGVYGPGERFFFYEFMNMIASGISVIAPSPLTGRVVFVHITDVVDALITLSTDPSAIGNTYNITADKPESYRSIVETISDCVQVPRPLIYLKTWMGVGLMTLIAPIANLGKSRVFVYHPTTVRQTVNDRIYSNRKLVDLGFRPRYKLLDGVKQTVRYELEHGGLKKGPLPAAFARAIHFVSVVVFAASRWTFGRRARR